MPVFTTHMSRKIPVTEHKSYLFQARVLSLQHLHNYFAGLIRRSREEKRERERERERERKREREREREHLHDYFTSA